MLLPNKERFEHRIKTIIGHLRHVLNDVEKDPSTSYGQLRTIEKSIQQASMFIIKDLIEQLHASRDKKKVGLAIRELYDCLGFHRDELPQGRNSHHT